MKPVPLFNILKHLEKEEKIEWAGRPIEEKGWFGNILGKVWSSNKTEKVEYSSSEKIVVIQYKNQEKAKLKFLIESELREETVIDYDYLRTSIFKQVSLSDESIE